MRATIEDRWGGRLGERFCPVSSFFLANYARLTPAPGVKGVNSTGAMLVIQLLDFKWTGSMPFPSIGTLAKRLGISERSVRDNLKRLEEFGYVNRVVKSGRTNRYDLTGLFDALEELMRVESAPAPISIRKAAFRPKPQSAQEASEEVLQQPGAAVVQNQKKRSPMPQGPYGGDGTGSWLTEEERKSSVSVKLAMATAVFRSESTHPHAQP